MIDASKNSYGQILQSTTLVGGSRVINMLVGIVRTKFMAVLLGPAGVGLMGMYLAVTGMMGTVTQLGIGSSGVRQIAGAVGTGDDTCIARTVKTLRRSALVLGTIGMLLTIVLSGTLSRLTFGNTHHNRAIAALSIILVLGAITNGQTALVQGMRRIADLAVMSVLGALLATTCSIPILYVWREAGIVPSLVVIAVLTIIPSWWYARKITVSEVALSLSDTWREVRGLLSLGLAVMTSGVMFAAVHYMTRVFVARKLGMDSVGMYQAASTLSSLYIGVILGAMGMDFYPRLTAVAEDNLASNRLVNEQTEVGLLVATPGILITLAFAHYLIPIFYSTEFAPAYGVLRWQILGIFLRVVSWPMGFMLLAKGKGKIYFWTELISNIQHVILIWFGLSFFGLVGTGIAFFLMYIFYTAMILMVVKNISGFRWSDAILSSSSIFSICITLVFLMPMLLPRGIALVGSSIMTIAVSIYCLEKLYKLVGPAWFIDFISRLRKRCGRNRPR